MEIIDHEEKEMISLTLEENANKSFVQMKIIYIKEKLKTIVIILENLEELPIVNAI